MSLLCTSHACNQQNRPLLSFKNPHFQNEAKCTIFLVKMSFICMRTKKSFSYQRLSTYSRFETEARGNSERLIANKHFYRIWGNEVSQAYNKSNVFCLFQIWNSWFWLFQTFIRDLVLSVPKIRIIDLRIIFANTEILDICFSKTLELWILAFPILEFWILAFHTLEFTVLVFSKHQNSVFWLFQTLKFSILAFPQHEFLDFVFFLT